MTEEPSETKEETPKAEEPEPTPAPTEQPAASEEKPTVTEAEAGETKVCCHYCVLRGFAS